LIGPAANNWPRKGAKSFGKVKKENPMNGGSLDDFLREEGVLEEVEAAAHQRVADLQKGGKYDSGF